MKTVVAKMAAHMPRAQFLKGAAASVGARKKAAKDEKNREQNFSPPRHEGNSISQNGEKRLQSTASSISSSGASSAGASGGGSNGSRAASNFADPADDADAHPTTTTNCNIDTRTSAHSAGNSGERGVDALQIEQMQTDLLSEFQEFGNIFRKWVVSQVSSGMQSIALGHFQEKEERKKREHSCSLTAETKREQTESRALAAEKKRDQPRVAAAEKSIEQQRSVLTTEKKSEQTRAAAAAAAKRSSSKKRNRSAVGVRADFRVFRSQLASIWERSNANWLVNLTALRCERRVPFVGTYCAAFSRYFAVPYVDPFADLVEILNRSRSRRADKQSHSTTSSKKTKTVSSRAVSHQDSHSSRSMDEGQQRYVYQEEDQEDSPATPPRNGKERSMEQHLVHDTQHHDHITTTTEDFEVDIRDKKRSPKDRKSPVAPTLLSVSDKVRSSCSKGRGDNADTDESRCFSGPFCTAWSWLDYNIRNAYAALFSSSCSEDLANEKIEGEQVDFCEQNSAEATSSGLYRILQTTWMLLPKETYAESENITFDSPRAIGRFLVFVVLPSCLGIIFGGTVVFVIVDKLNLFTPSSLLEQSTVTNTSLREPKKIQTFLDDGLDDVGTFEDVTQRGGKGDPLREAKTLHAFSSMVSIVIMLAYWTVEEIQLNNSRQEQEASCTSMSLPDPT
ncbi:unnamed protein product [Amoebophrya sp. A25]|nr:unnamed protein product [Amoebophrya sp. A25]|eukprot:GSA25T00005960001.1